MKSKVIIITQARIGSTRFPGKVIKQLGLTTVLGVHLNRLKKSKIANHIIVATTNEYGSEEIIQVSKKEKVDFFKGSTNDVLDRFYKAALIYQPKYIVRVTSDCPLIDPKLLDDIVKRAIDEDIDYCSNVLNDSYPDGQDVEVFKFKVLKDAWLKSKLKSDREHVTPYIIRNSDFKGGNLYKSFNYDLNGDYSSIRMTVDEEIDLKTIEYLTMQLGFNESWIDYAKFIYDNPQLFFNQTIKRNEGYIKSLKND